MPIISKWGTVTTDTVAGGLGYSMLCRNQCYRPYTLWFLGDKTVAFVTVPYSQAKRPAND